MRADKRSRPSLVMIVLLACVVSTGTAPGARQAHHTASLDRALADSLRDAGTSGVSAAVIFADGSRWTGTAGLADVQTLRRVTSKMPFAVASVTKTFVAALALQLAHEGRFRLDDPVSKWLPTLVNGDRITVRQLLDHTSGLESGPPPRAATYRWSPTQVLAQGQTFACDPGTCLRYSDMGYVAVGAVLESVTGESLASLLRDRILRPLGLNTTWLQGFERQRGRLALHVSDADDDSGIEPSTEFATRTGAAGALAATASDLAEWGHALFTGDLLDASVPDAMLDFDAAARLPCPAADECPGEYGLGMQAQLIGGWLAWIHSGSTGSVLVHFPRQHVTIAVLTNAEPGSASGAAPVLNALVASMPELRARTDVFGVNPDGTARRRITHSAGLGGAPAISPDGRRVVFATEREGGREIAVSDLDGKQVEMLTHNRAQDTLPAWSPDGARIVFVSERDGDWEIYVMDSDGEHQTRLTSEPGEDWAPVWSPDGTMIAYDHHEDSTLAVRVMNPDGTSVRTIAQVTTSPGLFPGSQSWSPDGRRVAFVGSDGGDTDIQVVDVDGSGLTTITDDHAPEFDPAWGPDGALAYVRRGDLYVVVPRIGATPRRVTSTYAEEFRPAWSRDGSLVFAGISRSR
jgi:CubicO group peptidase (beta-lactamase class C family)